jgi:hypothetical protein
MGATIGAGNAHPSGALAFPILVFFGRRFFYNIK